MSYEQFIATMEQLRMKADLIGKKIPAGLLHVLLHNGQTRKDVYKYMYGQLVYGGKKAPPGSTVIYPEEIRQAMRERLPGEAGAHDEQYKDLSAGTHLSLEEMASFEWRNPPVKCLACKKQGQSLYKPY